MRDPSTGAVAHRIAMQRLLDTDRRIEELDRRGIDVSFYRENLMGWTQAVVVYPSGWNQGSNSNNFPPAAGMQMLHSLALLIDHEFDQVRVAETDIQDFLDQVQQALAEDDAIGDAMRWYIFKLITDIRQTVDDHELMDRFDLNDALQRLWASLQGAAHQSAQPTRWEKFSEFIWTAAAGAVASIPQLAMSAVPMMLPPGP